MRPPIHKVNVTASSTIGENVYDIYVSQFNPTTTCDDIVNHIAANTDFTSDDFEVILLANKRLMKFKAYSYVSFKISTSAVNVYNDILNEKLWAPDFSAKPYNQKSSNKSNSNKIDSVASEPLRQNLRPPENVPKINTPNQSNKSGNNNINERKTVSTFANSMQSNSNQQQKRNSKSQPKPSRRNDNNNAQDFRFARHNHPPHNQHHCQQSKVCCQITPTQQHTPPSQQQQTGQIQIPSLQELHQQWTQLQQIFGHQQSAPTVPYFNNQWQQQQQQKQQQQFHQFQRHN